MINQLILLPDMTKLKVEQKMKVEGEIHYHSICNSTIFFSPTCKLRNWKKNNQNPINFYEETEQFQANRTNDSKFNNTSSFLWFVKEVNKWKMLKKKKEKKKERKKEKRKKKRWKLKLHLSCHGQHKRQKDGQWTETKKKSLVSQVSSQRGYFLTVCSLFFEMGQTSYPVFLKDRTRRLKKLKGYIVRQAHVYPHLKTTTITRR
jgi:hypothetical protein